MDDNLRRGNAQLLICPWFSLSDRHELYRQLFDGSREEQLSAIRRIDAWKARSYPRVPLGIEVTMALIEALMFDDTSDTLTKPTPGVTASMLSMALVRFVNLVTEVGKSSNAMTSVSINYIAERMGIPEWIVDMRHSCTHSVVPPIDILRTAVVWSLSWVRLNYWLAEEELIEDAVKMPAIYGSESLQKALLGVKADLLVMSDCRTRPKREIVAAKTRVTTIMKAIIKSMTSRDLARMLLSDGLIFPDSRLTLNNSSEIEGDPCLATRQFHLWWPVMHLLSKSGGLVDLLVALIEEMNRRPRLRGKFASAWIPLLIKKCSLIEKLKRKDCKNYIRLIRILLKRCPAHAHLAISHLPKEKCENLMVLASMRAELYSNGSFVFEDPGIRALEEPSAVECDPRMLACPLGLLPEQLNKTTLDLELPNHVDSIYERRKTTDFDDSVSGCEADVEDAETSESRSTAWLL